jgi:polyhydroxyalkanoate synthesis regulator phasin
MKNLIERSILAGIGLFSQTREKSQEYVDKLVKDGEVRRDESKDLVDRLVKRGEEEREAVHKIVRDEISAVMDELDLVTKKDIQKLTNKINTLSKDLQK